MVYNLTYTRPPHRGSSGDSFTGVEKQASIDESVKSTSTCSMCHGIPEPLSFDRIIAGGTCPPCTLRDFLNYLKYIEHAAENLQFFLWLRNYTKQFNDLPDSQKLLSPEWKMSQAEAEALAGQTQSRQMKVSADTATALKGTGLEAAPTVSESEKQNPFYTPERSSSEENKDPPAPPSEISASDDKSGAFSSTQNSADMRKKAVDAFEEAGLKWQPFTIQPFRDEISRIIAIYIVDGAPRQLNLSAKERNTLLHALGNTTHPSAFRNVATTVEWSLRCQAHPNFIRWTICNGNRPRVIFARGLGIGGIVAGIIVDLLITLSGVSRAWRVMALILYIIGISTLIAAWKGMCVVLHGMHHRHLRPWELFQDEDDQNIELKNESLDSIESYHSYETEPWVAKYEKRNGVRKIFDREVWVEEPALRQIQDTIFVQAIIGSLIGGVILTAIFVAVPAGNFY